MVASNGDISPESPRQPDTEIPDQRVDAQVMAGLPTIYTVHLAAGGTLQVYADPGSAGRNELHVTFFDPAGLEAPVTSATLRIGTDAAASASVLTVLTARMLEPGHFVADTELRSGSHELVITGVAPDGSGLSARLDLRITP